MCLVQQVSAHKPYDFSRMPVSEAFELTTVEQHPDRILIDEAGWVLYEFDCAASLAVFLDIRPDTDVFRTPFCYTAQTSAAKRYATLPFTEFITLFENNTAPKRIIHLFNIGHCGSTLLHHVLNESGEVWSLSELKFTFDLAMQREKLSADLRASLARAGINALGYYPFAKERDVLVLKHFSQASKIYETWRAATPGATNLYLYRDALGWCNSLYGFLQRFGVPISAPLEMRHFIWYMISAATPETVLNGILDLNSPDLHIEDILAVGWALHAKDFIAAQSAGLAAHAFRYNEMQADRTSVVGDILAACGFSDRSLSVALNAFDHDSHEGEVTSHDKPVLKLSTQAKQRILNLLAHPLLSVDPEILL